MPMYRCFIRGENFLLLTDPSSERPLETPKLCGFYTARWVVATDEVRAEQEALSLLKLDDSFAPPFCQPDPNSKVYFEDISIATRRIGRKQGGAVWFAMDDEGGREAAYDLERSIR